MISPKRIKIIANAPEIFVVESFIRGRQGVYDNFSAAKEHVDEMSTEDPNDQLWIESERLRSH